MKMPKIPNPLNLLKKDKSGKQAKSQANLEVARHSLAHLLAAALKEIYGDDVKLAIGPTIESGFYYDFEYPSGKTPDLEKIENKMRELLPSWIQFTHKGISANDAKASFIENQYKSELIDEIEGKKEAVTLYTCGGFTDLCRGGHVENPAKDIAPDSFKLSHPFGSIEAGLCQQHQRIRKAPALCRACGDRAFWPPLASSRRLRDRP